MYVPDGSNMMRLMASTMSNIRRQCRDFR